MALPDAIARMEIVPIHAIPKSPANKVEGWEADANGNQWLKVRVTAAAEDGKANKALITLLSKEWDVPVSRLQIVSGEKSRYKRLKIT